MNSTQSPGHLRGLVLNGSVLTIFLVIFGEKVPSTTAITLRVYHLLPLNTNDTPMITRGTY